MIDEESVAVEGPPKEPASINRDSKPVGPGTGGCFDCNICLDFAVDPVVTLCGHLYCWPCIYHWLQLDAPAAAPPQHCPVCKAALSKTTLVPLYGRGRSTKDSIPEIPRRPSPSSPVHVNNPVTGSEPLLARRSLAGHHHRHPSGSYMSRSPSTSMARSSWFHLGGNAVAILPWVFGNHDGDGLYNYSRSDYLLGSGGSPELVRQEMQAKRSLHRISFFLFCGMALCFFLF